MDERTIELLRDLDRSPKGPLEVGSPLSEILDLGDELVPTMIEALGHGDPVVRRMAAYVLSLCAPTDRRLTKAKQAVPHLERMLQADPDPVVRMYVAEALWLIDGSEMAISASIDGLKSPVVEARRVAAIVLGLVASEGHDTIAPLTAALDDADLKVRTTAAAGLSNFGPAAAGSLPGIERLLGEKDEFALVTAVHAILSIDSSRAEELVPRLATVLKTGSGRSRQRAVEVLGEIPAIGALAVPPLIEALDDEDQDIRSMSMRSLQAIGPLAALAVPNLINILRGLNKHVGDILVRGRAVDALGAIGPAAHEATPHLLAYLPLTLPLSELIRLPTSRPLSQPPSLAAWYFFVRVAHALWRIERDPKHLLSVGLEAIRHPKWLVRNLAVERLGDLGAAGQPAIAHLRQCLQDERLGVRLSARQSLEKIERG